uniref:CSD domain-containing protein n=1 Tax=Guillardia theta TaxID=55529 RepID=A0A7S4JEA7_GUITH|mmetsp:Transcript_15676/g.52450  ORF Transcript_15676/g.52450 Transcript_15676/m.52450 type:complete len:1210 (+) Transcript_15676:199-3828(+)
MKHRDQAGRYNDGYRDSAEDSGRRRQGGRNFMQHDDRTERNSDRQGRQRNNDDDEFRMCVKKIMDDFLKGDEVILSFPPQLTARERKVVHEFCEMMELVHESSGEGDARHIIVNKNVNSVEGKGIKYVSTENLMRSGGKPRASGGSKFSSNEEKEKDSAPREVGFVWSLKENYGFVRHADTEGQYFFHFSELRDADPSELTRGSEVEFGLHQSRPGEKTMAVRVVLLPKGTIKMEETVRSGLEGVIIRELRESRSYDRSQKRELYGGRVLLPAADEGPEGEAGSSDAASSRTGGGKGVKAGKGSQDWIFGGDDVLPKPDGGRYMPAEGDMVRFDVVYSRSSKSEKATNILFVSSTAQKGAVREMGTVTMVKDSYGFIKCCDRDERLFFHFSEVNQRDLIPRVGDEIEFTVQADREGRNVAVQITPLPKGTVVYTKILDGRLKGTVERPLKIPSSKKSGFSNSGRGNSEAFGGTIKYVDSEGKQAKIQFDGSDLNDYRGHFPFIGDEVDFQICMDKPTKKLRAVDVKIISFGAQERERGIIMRCKEGLNYCFIKCCNREDPLFMHLSEFVGPDSTPVPIDDEKSHDSSPENDGNDVGASEGVKSPDKNAARTGKINNGDEVEFNVSESKADGRLMAVRVTKLPPGSVSFEETLPGKFEGIVERPLPENRGIPSGMSKKLKDKDIAFKGLLRPLEPIVIGETGEEEPKAPENENEEKPVKEKKKSSAKSKSKEQECEFLTWTANDLANPSVFLHHGDKVNFTIILDKQYKRLRAASITLAEAKLGEGEQEASEKKGPLLGLIAAVKHSHGWIKCNQLENFVYFSFTDVDHSTLANVEPNEVEHKNSPGDVHEQQEDENAEHDEHQEHDKEEAGAAPDGHAKLRKPKANDEVSFYLVSEPSTRVLKAEDIKILPKGSVEVETFMPTRFKGVVSGRAGGSMETLHAATGGTIKHVEGDKVEQLKFSNVDVDEPRHLILDGQHVEYSVAVDSSGAKRARHVVALPTEGTIQGLEKNWGLVKALSSPPELDRLIAFESTEVEKGDAGKLDIGSDVQFFYTLNPKTFKDIVAVRLKRYYRQKEPERMPERMKRQQDVARVVARMAAGPEDGKGFSAPMTRRPHEGYPILGGKLKPQTTLNANVTEFVPSFSEPTPVQGGAPQQVFPPANFAAFPVEAVMHGGHFAPPGFIVGMPHGVAPAMAPGVNLPHPFMPPLG